MGLFGVELTRGGDWMRLIPWVAGLGALWAAFLFGGPGRGQTGNGGEASGGFGGGLSSGNGASGFFGDDGGGDGGDGGE